VAGTKGGRIRMGDEMIRGTVKNTGPGKAEKKKIKKDGAGSLLRG